MPSGKGNITQLLRAWEGGDKTALDKLVPLVYGELHGLAHRYMSRQAPGHSLQTTALIHEVYVRLVNVREMKLRDRAHFFAVCARAMRQILTDYARSRQSLKRGAAAAHTEINEALHLSQPLKTDLVALDDALHELSKVDPRAGQVVELRFYGGLSAMEAGEVLDISEETVTRDWRMAKAWLRRELSRGPQDGA